MLARSLFPGAAEGGGGGGGGGQGGALAPSNMNLGGGLSPPQIEIMTIYDRSYQYLIIVGCWIPIARFGGYRYGPNTRGPNYAAYEVRVNGQCV